MNNSPLIRDSRLLLYLFIGFRLMLLLVYQPMPERGLTFFGDYQHYYNLASLTEQGFLPYRDYWYEFPPVFPIINLTVYSLIDASSGANNGSNFSAYATLFGLVMLAFDVANLFLVRRIGAALHGKATGEALGWIYAALATPFVFTFWTFEPIVACAVLYGLATLIDGRDTRSALGTALGALTKFVPLVILGAVWRFRPRAEALRYTAIAVGITAVGIAAMLAIGGRFGAPSLLAQFSKASYQSVWALMDGNYKTGNFGAIPDHFEPEKAYEPLGNPAAIPSWVRLIVFGGIGAAIFATTRRSDSPEKNSRGIAAFVLITLIVFFLWSQGWSPQWQMILVPLILLNMPNRGGVLVCLVLGLVSFAEYPLLFSRTAETEGAIPPNLQGIYAVIILLRTALLIGVGVTMYNRLRKSQD
jgi:hypothetical protein